jgi:cyclic beta-1,2-glucan synthetase
VRRQIAYGKSLGLPWGVSESAYNIRDLELTYQYSNFGVPGLGLKRAWARAPWWRPTRRRLPAWSIRHRRHAISRG